MWDKAIKFSLMGLLLSVVFGVVLLRKYSIEGDWFGIILVLILIIVPMLVLLYDSDHHGGKP